MKSDAKELTQRSSFPVEFDTNEIATSAKIELRRKNRSLHKLKQENKKVEALLNNKDPKAAQALEKLFDEWAEQVVRMRLIQEYETIKGSTGYS